MQHQNSDNIYQINFNEFTSIDSTNNYALKLAHEGLAQHGKLIFAHEQTAGKGQRGKQWAAKPGENLQMSLILNPQPVNLHNRFALSALVALAARDFVEKYAASEIYIKWPNDIYFQDRKAGGILIENVIVGSEWKWAVVGIGININQTTFDSSLPNPVSLKQITGKTFDPVILAKELAIGILEKHKSFKNIQDLMKEYNEHLYKKNNIVKLKKENRIFETTIKNVNAFGQLMVHNAIEEAFDFGEVTWVI